MGRSRFGRNGDSRHFIRELPVNTHRGVYSLSMNTFRDVRFSSYAPATLRRCYYHRAVFVRLPGSHVAPNMQSMHWKTQFLDVWTLYTFVCILVARYPSSFRVPQTLPRSTLFTIPICQSVSLHHHLRSSSIFVALPVCCCCISVSYPCSSVVVCMAIIITMFS